MPQHMEVARDSEGRLRQWRAEMQTVIVLGVIGGAHPRDVEIEIPTDEGGWVLVGGVPDPRG